MKSGTDSNNDPRGTFADIQALCRARNIDTAESRPVIKEGWMGKPKGILQILIERGLIDKINLNQYSLDGKKGVSLCTSIKLEDIERLVKQKEVS